MESGIDLTVLGGVRRSQAGRLTRDSRHLFGQGALVQHAEGGVGASKCATGQPVGQHFATVWCTLVYLRGSRIAEHVRSPQIRRLENPGRTFDLEARLGPAPARLTEATARGVFESRRCLRPIVQPVPSAPL